MSRRRGALDSRLHCAPSCPVTQDSDLDLPKPAFQPVKRERPSPPRLSRAYSKHEQTVSVSEGSETEHRTPTELSRTSARPQLRGGGSPAGARTARGLSPSAPGPPSAARTPAPGALPPARPRGAPRGPGVRGAPDPRRTGTADLGGASPARRLPAPGPQEAPDLSSRSAARGAHLPGHRGAVPPASATHRPASAATLPWLRVPRPPARFPSASPGRPPLRDLPPTAAPGRGRGGGWSVPRGGWGWSGSRGPDSPHARPRE